MHVKIMSYVLTIKLFALLRFQEMPFDEIRDVIENTSSPQTRLRVYKKNKKPLTMLRFLPVATKEKYLFIKVKI